MIGIYQIISKIDDKKYIGSSTDINRRMTDHKRYLKNNIHRNKFLQNAWNKHKEDNFEFILIEVCEKEQLLSKEIEYINFFKSNDRNFGYNIAHPITTTQDISREFIKNYNNKKLYNKIYKNNSSKKMSETKRKKGKASYIKLNWQIVREIRKLVEENKEINYSTISRIYKVHRSQISRIINNVNWRELE